MYRITFLGVRRDADNADIPMDDRNMDWLAYKEWLAAGNKPEPQPANTPEHLKRALLDEEKAVE